jgi:3-hydroxyacyl-CoA dehydrogenase
MSSNQPVHRIAIVGTGVIGASWAAYYLARGFDVVATDPGPQAEASLRKYVDEAWPLLTQAGLSPGASRDRLTFSPDMSRALSKADWVQENAPERPDFKIKLFAQMDEATPPTPDGPARSNDEDARYARDHAATETDGRRCRAEGGRRTFR